MLNLSLTPQLQQSLLRVMDAALKHDGINAFDDVWQLRATLQMAQAAQSAPSAPEQAKDNATEQVG